MLNIVLWLNNKHFRCGILRDRIPGLVRKPYCVLSKLENSAGVASYTGVSCLAYQSNLNSWSHLILFLLIFSSSSPSVCQKSQATMLINMITIWSTLLDGEAHLTLMEKPQQYWREQILKFFPKGMFFLQNENIAICTIIWFHFQNAGCMLLSKVKTVEFTVEQFDYSYSFVYFLDAINDFRDMRATIYHCQPN